MAAVLVLLGTIPGCTRNDRGPDVIARGSALTSPIVNNGVKNTYKMAIRTGVVTVATVEHFEAHSDVVLDSIMPLRLASGLELLGVRVNFIVKKGSHGFRGMPGVFCTDRWPPPRLVDLLEVPRLRMKSGNQIGITVFARAREPGDHALAGVRVRYRERQVLREQTTESTTLTVVSRDSESDLPQSAACPPNIPSRWLGEDEPAPGQGDHADHGHDHSKDA